MRSVAFDVTNLFATGQESGIALNTDDVLVEVHREKTNQLVSRVGTAFGPYAQWRGEGLPYANGTSPRVAVSQGSVVVVHETADGKFAYFIGNIGGSRVNFIGERPSPYGAGKSPAVALTKDRLAIGIDEDGKSSHTIFFRLGTFSPTATLDGWDNARPIPKAFGTKCSIAVNDSGTVVAAWQATNGTTFTCVGIRQGFTNIDWGSPVSFGTVLAPSVALTNDGLVIIAVLATDKVRVAYRVGQADAAAKTIAFGDNVFGNILSDYRTFDKGSVVNGVSVTTNGRFAFLTFANKKNQAGYSGSLMLDRANWMRDSLPALGTKNLKQIAVPGSHDASTYVIDRPTCTSLGAPCNTLTQIVDIYKQLQAGARYFDIRPVFTKGQLGTGHFGDDGDGTIFGRFQGCQGPPLATILGDVKRFIEGSGTRELVMLKFSHYVDVDTDKDVLSEAQFKQLTTTVQQTLGDYLYNARLPRKPGERLSDRTLNSYLGARPVILALFDVKGSGGIFPTDPLVYAYRDYNELLEKPNFDRNFELTQFDFLVYDKFAKKNDLGELRTDQKNKLKIVANHGGDLFLYSWTLTQSTTQALGCNDSNTFYSDILALAGIASSGLAQNIAEERANGDISDKTMINVIYLDSFSGFGTDVTCWLNQRTYLGDTLVAADRPYLGPGDSLVSAGNIFRLTYQAGEDNRDKGNLVIYNVANGSRVRSITGEGSKPAWRFVLIENGSLIVYSEPYSEVYRVNSEGHLGSRLKLNDDGTLILYGADGGILRPF